MKLFAGMVFLSLSLFAQPERARACLLLDDAVIEAAYPRPGQSDVPTNAVLFVYGRTLAAAQLQLATADGAPIAIHVEPAETSGFDITPEQPLEPHTRYVLLANDGEYTGRVDFETGAGPMAEEDSSAWPDVRFVERRASGGNCGELSNLCAVTQIPDAFTIEVRFASEVLSFRPPLTFKRKHWAVIGDEDCISVRSRNAVGQRSPPVMVCGEALKRIAVSGPTEPLCPELPLAIAAERSLGDAAEGASAAAMLAADGCSAAGAPLRRTHAPALYAFAVALLGLYVRRRR